MGLRGKEMVNSTEIDEFGVRVKGNGKGGSDKMA